MFRTSGVIAMNINRSEKKISRFFRRIDSGVYQQNAQKIRGVTVESTVKMESNSSGIFLISWIGKVNLACHFVSID